MSASQHFKAPDLMQAHIMPYHGRTAEQRPHRGGKGRWGGEGKREGVYLRFSKNLTNKVPNSPIVDKGSTRKSQNEVAAELARVG